MHASLPIVLVLDPVLDIENASLCCYTDGYISNYREHQLLHIRFDFI